MKHLKVSTVFLLLITFDVLSNACSKGKSPVEPLIATPQEMSQDIPVAIGTEENSRTALSIYECMIDPDAKTFTVKPANRSAEYHFPLTNLYPNVLQITGFGFILDKSIARYQK